VIGQTVTQDVTIINVSGKAVTISSITIDIGPPTDSWRLFTERYAIALKSRELTQFPLRFRWSAPR